MTTQDLINTLKQTSSPISSKLVSKIVGELEYLQERVQIKGELCCEYKKLARDYEGILSKRKEQLSRQERAIMGVREVCALPDATLEELPSMIETLLSELADRQIQRDVEQATDPVYDDWAPEDTVVPRPEPSCRGCVGLAEIDGRLMCMDARSQHYGGGITWPGPGCVWASCGGGRG